MTGPERVSVDVEGDAPGRPHRRRTLALVLGGLLIAVLAAIWLTREDIADSYIAGELERMGLPATYDIVSIGPGRQVVRDVVIGNPARPDLTIEEVSVAVEARFGLPRVGRITLVRPRLYGSVRDGKPSFGSLDKVLFTGSKEPFRLPDLDIAARDGRARIVTDHGPVGVKIDGAGPLRGGFEGVVAAVAPRLRAEDCAVSGASVYGRLTVARERPRFQGPARLATLDCGGGALALRRAALGVDATIDPAFDGVDARIDAASGLVAARGLAQAGSLGGKVCLRYRNRAVSARYDLTAGAVRTGAARLDRLGTAGTLRSTGGLNRIEAEGEVTGAGIAPGDTVDSALAGAERAAADTFAGPMIRQMRGAFAREASGSRFGGRYIWRKGPGGQSLVVPQALLTGSGGDALLAVSRVQMGGAPARVSGNFFTGGAGLPRIAGRMEQGPRGQVVLRLSVAEYRAGDGALAVPELVVAQAASGALGFSGRMMLSGALPGGRAERLTLPLDGTWSQRGGLALWRRCAALSFDRLAVANLVLDRRRLALCPAPGSAIVRVAPNGGAVRVAAGAPSLDLAGRLGGSAIRVASGPVGIAWPGAITARRVAVSLGNPAAPTRFVIDRLDAVAGADIAGRFAGSEVRLAAVPLDMTAAEGRWRYAGGALTIDGAAFRLTDRAVDARFQPLVAQGARLVLAANRIKADAVLREPGSGREVVRADIAHDLGTGRGRADIAVPGLTFDNAVQPVTISRLALGVIANARGAVSGTGRIDWTPDSVTSTGRFGTDALDFAAAFGPVRGVSGTVEFTDLLGLVTAPDQRLRIAEINPGIAVENGELSFSLPGESVLLVNGARWPFLDGTLELLPTRMVLGVAEVRRYSLRVEGISAARFIERMELANISATGTFDGVLPLVFDENGGRIEGGLLTSRPPGGNVSYVGQLTYKDLSPIANFAFDALKSLDYKQMRVAMDGALEGEIVTRVRFSGVSQGEGARRNFLTRRLAGLPLQFNVNLRAPFYQLITSFKSMYDPAYVRDPRELGLIGADGKPIQPPESGTSP